MSIIIANTTVKIRRNTLAKRVIIKVRFGHVELIIPKRASVKRAVKFLWKKEDWVIAKLKDAPQFKKLEIGSTLTIFDKDYQIVYAGMRGKSELDNHQLLIHGDILMANKRIKKLLYQTLKQEIERLAYIKAKQLNLIYKKISIRDNISRWGSCSSKGTLSFCWRLVFAPLEIVEYLVCHELAHLREMNHSVKFWDVVGELYPNYKAAEFWLKKNGNSLYLYD